MILHLCSGSLATNLSLWSVISNERSISQIGHYEEGMKHKSLQLFISFQ